MPPSKTTAKPRSQQSPKSHEDNRPPSQHSDSKHDQHPQGETAPEMNESELLADNETIEADAEIEAEVDFDALVGDDEFIVTDSTDFLPVQQSNQEDSHPENTAPKEEPKERYVIPKLKRPDGESSHDRGRRDGDDSRRDRDRNRRDRSERDEGRHHEKGDSRRGKGSHNGQTPKGSPRAKEEAKDVRGSRSFTDAFKQFQDDEKETGGVKKEQTEPAEQPTESKPAVPETAAREQSEEENLEPLEIPEGRDSVASVRERYPWQIRVFPVSRSDVTRSEFGQLWAIPDSSAIAWSTDSGAGGVAEFLLQKRDSIQKFMRKAMFHAYSNQVLTVEITERATQEEDKGKVENAAEEKQEKKEPGQIINKAIFRFSNRLARQLIKTFYPTPKGDVTERSLYVNNIGPGVSTDIMKAIFPCSLKIGVAKASKAASLALVETESSEAAFHYLVVYDQICINKHDLLLSTSEYDWQGARDKFNRKTQKPGLLKSPPQSSKRPSTDTTKRAGEPPSKKDRPSNSSASRSRDTGRGPGRGRGGPAARGTSAKRGRGRGLLPDPIPRNEGLLPPPPPPPLMSLPPLQPSNPALVAETEFMLAQEEHERRTAELREVRHQLEAQVLETRANLVMAARRAEAQAVAQLQSRLSQLDHIQSAGSALRSSAAGDYYPEEEPLEARRTLLRHEELPSETRGYSVRGSAEYARPRAPAASASRDYEPRAYPRDVHEEEYADVVPRSAASQRARPYLLEAPGDVPPQRSREEKELYPPTSHAETYDYGHAAGHPHGPRYEEAPAPREEGGRSALLRRGEGLLDRPRRALVDERIPKSHEIYEYDERESTSARAGYPPTRRYEEEGLHGRSSSSRLYAERDPAAYSYDRRY